MTYTMEDFENQKTIIFCESQEEWDEFLKECEEHNIRWASGDKATYGRNYYSTGIDYGDGVHGMRVFNGYITSSRPGMYYHWSDNDIRELYEYRGISPPVIPYREIGFGASSPKINIPKKAVR